MDAARRIRHRHIAKMLTPRRDPQGSLITSGIGIARAVIAKSLGEALHLYAPGQRAGFLGGVIGAILLLLAYHAIRGKNPQARHAPARACAPSAEPRPRAGEAED